jgi:hypothetical protein
MAANPRKATKLGRTANGLPRYYMDTGWWRSRKYAGMALDSIGLMSAIVGYSTEHSTDGHVPADHEDLAAALGLRASGVAEALAPLVDRGVLDTWGADLVVVGWRDHNPTRSEVERYTSERSKFGSKGNHTRWHSARNVVDPECPWCRSSDPGSDRSSDDRSDRSIIARDAVSDIANAALAMSQTPDGVSETPGQSPKHRSSDRQSVAKRSHGMGWDGIPPQGSSQQRSGLTATTGSAGASPGGEPTDQLPPSYRTCDLAPVAPLVLRTGDIDQDLERLWTVMAHTHLALHTRNNGTRIRHPEGWLTKDADLTRQAYQDDARHELEASPTLWLDLIAERLEPDACGPLDGGKHRRDQDYANTLADLADRDAAAAEAAQQTPEQRAAGFAHIRAALHDRPDGGS